MLRRVVIGVVAGLFMAGTAVPAEAAEWCTDDPALSLAAPHASKITLYVTEGVMGSAHLDALRKAHIDHKIRPGKAPHSLHVTVHGNIPSDRFGSFSTLLIVSSRPFGAGTVYGSTRGVGGKPMQLSFDLSYP
jgi:hypothetical protein